MGTKMDRFDQNGCPEAVRGGMEPEWTESMALDLAKSLCSSYIDDGCAGYAGRSGIPQRDIILLLLEQLLELLFPGYTGRKGFSREGQLFSTGDILNKVYKGLSEQIGKAFMFRCKSVDCSDLCRGRASQTAMALLRKLPSLRSMLLDDAQAALEGDPAASSLDEIILAYPGFKCVCIHRIAHELYMANVPLVPRVMSEFAHSETGIDINPGATIGSHFFIDHGTGVVVGETAVIGKNVKLYQGVTLGALSFPKDATGKLIKGNKRHPNIEDDVTIYAEATILGNVTIGHHSVIGGNVWLTEPVPPYSKVTVSPSKLHVQVRNVPPTKKEQQ